MSDLDTLRRAADAMRRDAEAATPGPWIEHYPGQCCPGGCIQDDLGVHIAYQSGADAAYIAAWDPNMALAVAHWLDREADWLDDEFPDDPDAPMDWESSTGLVADKVNAALTVAREYLGETA